MSWSFDFIFATASCVRVWHVKKNDDEDDDNGQLLLLLFIMPLLTLFPNRFIGHSAFDFTLFAIKAAKNIEWVKNLVLFLCSIYSMLNILFFTRPWHLVFDFDFFFLRCYLNLNTHSNAFIKPFHFIHPKIVWDDALFVCIFCFYSYCSQTNTDDWTNKNVWNEYFIHPIWFDLQKLTIDFQYLPYFNTLFT